ncbi:Cof-type HAD-IIB family hydrolase [uncultured Deinococcus sp.]|uniref:Cof-type HAD-IIB family hydrolase n=1 Tax=uncultured Deinococcus sp. TaxID=158789 RepID=UPI00374A1AFD
MRAFADRAPRLIAIDLDGTLLGDDNRVSPGNLAAVRAAQAAGHLVVIATGRSLPDVRALWRGTGLVCPAIACNGALTCDAQGEVQATVPLDRSLALELLERTAGQGLYTELYMPETTYVTPDARAQLARERDELLPPGEREAGWEVAERHFAQVGLHPTGDMARALRESAAPPLKLLVFTFGAAQREALARTLGDRSDLGLTRSSPYNLELSHPDAQKGAALARLASAYGFGPERVVAIGDSLNDLSMMRFAGHAVAMGGAHPDVLTACADVTGPCGEDGVAQALTTLLALA